MTMFAVIRRFAAAGATGASEQGVEDVNRELGVNWVCSYVAEDGSESVAIYEAPDAELLRQHGLFVGLPVDQVIPVQQVIPEFVFQGTGVAE